MDADNPIPIWARSATAYRVLGLDRACDDEVFWQLVLARWSSRPASSTRSGTGRVGIAAPSYPTIKRRLPVYATAGVASGAGGYATAGVASGAGGLKGFITNLDAPTRTMCWVPTTSCGRSTRASACPSPTSGPGRSTTTNPTRSKPT